MAWAHAKAVERRHLGLGSISVGEKWITSTLACFPIVVRGNVLADREDLGILFLADGYFQPDGRVEFVQSTCASLSPSTTRRTGWCGSSASTAGSTSSPMWTGCQGRPRTWPGWRSFRRPGSSRCRDVRRSGRGNGDRLRVGAGSAFLEPAWAPPSVWASFHGRSRHEIAHDVDPGTAYTAAAE